jgi:hypothetical protein
MTGCHQQYEQAATPCRSDALLALVCARAVEGFCHPDVQDFIYVDAPETAAVSFVSGLALPSASEYRLQIT